MSSYLSEKKKNLSRKLYEEVFHQDPEAFVDYYYQKKVKKNKVLVKVNQGNVVGMLHINPHKLSVKGICMNIPYIFAVATAEEYRRKGIMRELLEKAIADLYKKNLPFTYLIPVAEGIYEPYGFTFISRRIDTFYQIKDENEFVLQNPDLFKLVSISSETLETYGNTLVRFVNNKLAFYSECSIKRSKEYFRDLLLQLECGSGKLSLIFKSNKLIGYCYTDSDEEPVIREFICEKKYEKIFLQKLCVEHGVQQIMVKGKLERNDYHLNESEQRESLVMARILSLQSFSKYISSDSEMWLKLHLTDPVIMENQGTYLWKLLPERSWFYKLNGDSTKIDSTKTDSTRIEINTTLEDNVTSPNLAGEISLSIDELTSWLFGYRKLADQYQGEIRKRLESIRTIQSVYILDEV